MSDTTNGVPAYHLWTVRDLDGFFGLFVDNLVQLLLIVTLCTYLCGMKDEASILIFGRILPGAAISVLVGNIFYAWQAKRLAARTGRQDVTALPYGINTPSLLVYVFFVMVPTFERTKSAEAAWQMGLVACLGSGIIEFAGSFVAPAIRRNTPRAALLSTLAGIAIGFISMTFALKIWQYPLVAMIPMALVLAGYFGRVRWAGGLPAGLLAVMVGTLLAWCLPSHWTGMDMQVAQLTDAWSHAGWMLPKWCGGAILQTLQGSTADVWGNLTVIIPMGIFNVIGSLQNVESAEAAGDTFDTRSSLAANGIGTIIAALFGSCFPTTIYIGHPGWKAMGARAGYSILNGIVIALLCLSGTIAIASAVIPLEVGVAIVLWIGVIITAQAFQTTPDEHAPAVALGLFPAIAAWGATVVLGAFIVAEGATVEQVLRNSLTTEVSGFLLHGLNLLERGYIFTCMIVAAAAANLIDRRYRAAAIWCLFGAAATAAGLMHAYQVSGNTIDNCFPFGSSATETLSFHAYDIAIGYLAMGGIFWAADRLGKCSKSPDN
ncbi:MAG: hypothetical protein R3E01_35535 [Pirellulaceae bacterium]|nr:NCS2 family permease [Planctomycetales bacterium]